MINDDHLFEGIEKSKTLVLPIPKHWFAESKTLILPNPKMWFYQVQIIGFMQYRIAFKVKVKHWKCAHYFLFLKRHNFFICIQTPVFPILTNHFIKLSRCRPIVTSFSFVRCLHSFYHCFWLHLSMEKSEYFFLSRFFFKIN